MFKRLLMGLFLVAVSMTVNAGGLLLQLGSEFRLHICQTPKKVPVLYQEPSETSKILPALEKNQFVMILNENEKWCKLATFDTNEVGWVLKNQLKPNNSDEKMIGFAIYE